MHQFTATLSGSYPPVQQQIHKMHGVRQEHSWNQNFRGAPDTKIKQELPGPGRHSLFESAGYGGPSTSNEWLRQTGIIPLQGSPQPLFNRDPRAPERQLLVYSGRQPPSEYNGLADKSIPAQNIVHRNATYPPPFANEGPSRHLEYPPIENQSPSVTYGSFSSPQSEHRRKKAPRASQACRQCREAKARCQDEKPCQTCKDNGKDCEYTIPEPKKAEDKDLSKITIRLDRQEDLMRQILTRLAGPGAVLNIVHPATDLNALVEQPKKEDFSVSSQKDSPSSFGNNRFDSPKNEKAEPLPDFGPAVPLYHTTAASGILSWRSVQVIVGDTVPDAATREATMCSARHSQTKEESVRDANDSELDLRSGTASRLITRYIKHVHIIHPISSPGRLAALFKRFIKSSNPAKLMSNANKNEARGLKRKRLPEALNTFVGSKIGEPSIELAFFLLVLALGMVYDHREKLAHAFQEGGEEPDDSTSPRNSYPSPEEVDRLWKDRHRSVNGTVPQKLGNMDITPGLDYFVAATDIIGKIDYGDSQCYVQVQILISLYQRQLGKLSKSHAAISEAARALQAILRSKITKSRIMGWDNALLITFWTCLQIESEIVAELPVPQSSLDSWEQFMPWPNAQAEDFINTLQRDGYVTALWVRKHLNTILPKLYGYKNQETVDKVLLEEQATSSLVQSTIDSLEAYLLKVAGLPTSESNDSNSITILNARLNTKVLAAKIIALRPYLMMVLNREHADISEEAHDYARLCIETIQRGANAFRCLKDDRLVTYTQCGYVMILLDAFCDASLKNLVEFDLLKDLVKQVLDSLMAWPSSELTQKYVKVLRAMAVKAHLYEQPKLQNDQLS